MVGCGIYVHPENLGKLACSLILISHICRPPWHDVGLAAVPALRQTLPSEAWTKPNQDSHNGFLWCLSNAQPLSASTSLDGLTYMWMFWPARCNIPFSSFFWWLLTAESPTCKKDMAFWDPFWDACGDSKWIAFMKQILHDLESRWNWILPAKFPKTDAMGAPFNILSFTKMRQNPHRLYKTFNKMPKVSNDNEGPMFLTQCLLWKPLHLLR